MIQGDSQNRGLETRILYSINMKTFIILMSLLPLFAQARIFKVAQGDHFSTPLLTKVFVGTSMSMTVIFDETAKYEFSPQFASDQTDNNKLYGFADCATSHMQNSARFGWFSLNNQLVVTAFTHRGGKFYFQIIKEIETNRPYEASIDISADKKKYIYTFDGARVEVERGCEADKAIGYHLQPYFGGQQTAPHDVYITVKVGESYGPAIVDMVYPNPVSNGKINFKISTYEAAEYSFVLYDLQGRLVYRSEKQKIPSGENQKLVFDIGKRLASSMYLVVPLITTSDGTELRANIAGQISDRAMKLLIMNN